MPNIRSVAKQYRDTPENVWLKLLHSPYHEDRMCALVIMTNQYQSGDFEQQHDIVDAYLANVAYINNWDLVDISAHKILGAWKLRTRTKQSAPTLLLKMARSPDLWERRISMIATFAFIREGWLDPTFELAEKLLSDKHDLMHKAVGWMLREAGKRDEKRLTDFLDTHTTQMPRTMLRYAIEKLDDTTRKHYMGL